MDWKLVQSCRVSIGVGARERFLCGEMSPSIGFWPFSRFSGAGRWVMSWLYVNRAVMMTSCSEIDESDDITARLLKGVELLDFSRKGQSVLKPSVSSRPT